MMLKVCKNSGHRSLLDAAHQAIYLVTLATTLTASAFGQSTVSRMSQSHKRSVPTAPEISMASGATSFNSTQGPGPGPIGPGPGCNLFPAPASIGTTVPLSYFGPPPSSQNPSLVGPEQLLKSGMLDVAHGTITLPLYLGTMAGTG
jgi:hypothetical protein